jgi:hypothetical protein
MKEWRYCWKPCFLLWPVPRGYKEGQVELEFRHLGLCADSIYIYIHMRQTAKRIIVSRKLLRGLSAIGTWCERWNTEINQDKTEAIYFSHRLGSSEVHLTLNGRKFPFVNYIKCLAVGSDKRITWRLHIEKIEAKGFRTFVRIYSLFKSGRLSSSIKLTLHKALIRSVMTYACSAWLLAADM